MIVKTIVIHGNKINITDYHKLVGNVERTYYRARITTFYNPQAHIQKQKTLSGKTIDEVEQQIYQAFNAGSVFPKYNNLSITVEEALTEFINMRYTGNTLYTNLNSCKNQVFPEIGDILVQKLSQSDMQQFANVMEDDGYSSNTINRTISLVRVCMEEFVHRQQIPFNPCMDLKLPRPAPSKGIALTVNQLDDLMAHLSSSEYYLFYNILSLMALRVGECRGLSWNKIDFDTHKITIDQQIPSISRKINNRVKNNNPTSLVYEDAVFDILLKARELQERYIRNAADQWHNPDNLVFTMKCGGPVPYNHVRLDFKAAAEKIGIPELRMHDLRHTYASHLWEESHKLELVSLILRHLTPATTRVYIHPTEKTHDECLALREKVSAKLLHPTATAVFISTNDVTPGPAKASSLLKPFLGYMIENKLSRHTVVLRQNILEHRAFKIFGEKFFDDVTSNDIRAVYEQMRKDGLCAGSLYGAYSSMQAYFKYAILKGVATKNPVEMAGIIPHA